MAADDVQVGFSADPGSAAAFEEIVQRAVSTGIEKGLQGLTGALKSIGPKLVSELGKQISEGMKGASKGFESTTTAARGLDEVLSRLNRDSLAIAKALREVGAGTSAIAAGINRAKDAEVRSSIETNQSLARASNERLTMLRNEGKLAAIETQSAGQLQVVSAREAGKQRTEVVRTALKIIEDLERGSVRALEGIAKTGVSAIGRVFSGLGSVFKRADKETFNNSVLEKSLHERESLMRSSFEKQSLLVRESVTRQEATLTSLQASTNKGLIGSAKNAGVFGFGAGFAAFAAIKSTFTVGADFTRGLAVLQSSLDLTDVQMKKVRQTSIDLGNDITLPGVSALDAAQGIQTLTKQFGSLGPAAVDAAQAAAKGTLQLARASGASADDAAALIGSSVNVFKVSASDAVFAADAITGALTRAAGVGFTDFKDSFIQGATVFESFVGNAEDAKDTLLDFNTTLAILAKNGITGSNAGAGLKQFFIQASAQTKGAVKATAQVVANAGASGTIFFDASHKARTFADSIDILRKGTQGLNDEAKRNVLGQLFGSRSVNIALALINSTGESFAQLREQIAKQGLAAKIAAAQNTGLKGAFDALSSVAETLQIIVFEKVNKPLGNAVLAVTNFANTILFGAGPALHTLRIGLLGAAAGLGALLALKGAVEVLSLLGKAAALAFTPIGAIALAAAGLGAAFALLNDKNPAFIGKLVDLKDKAIQLGREGLDFIVPKLEALRDFFTGTAIPAIERFASTVGSALVTAFKATVNFVQDTVIPGFERFVAFVGDKVVPVVLNGVDHLVSFVLRAKDVIVNFAQTVASTVLPFLQPAIDGFAKLGGALGSALGGNFSNLGSGLVSAGKGIASSAGLVGSTILDALRPVGEKVLGFFKGLFTVKNLFSAVGSIGEFLNIVGEKIGQFISNPKVIASVAIVAGALLKIAATWALSLARGLGEGILDNVPRLFNDVSSALGKVFTDPKLFATVAIAGALVATLGPAVVSAFRSIGEGGATGLLTGLKSKISGAGGFFSGLSGSAIGGNSAFGPIADEGKRFQLQLQDIRNEARRLGSTKFYDATTAGVAEGRADIARLKENLTEAQIAGLAFRDKLASAFRAIGGAIRGGGGIISGLTDIGTSFVRAGIESGDSFTSNLARNINAGGAKVKAGFAAIVDSLKTYAAEQGTSVGKVVAGGLVKGLAGATAGVAFGSQIGSGDGLSKILGLAGLASTAIAIGGPIGIATAGVGLLTAAFTSGRDRAKEYEAKIKDISNSLSPKLADAAKKGQLSLAQLQRGLTFGDVGKTSVFDDVTESLIGGLSTGTLKTLQDFKIGFAQSIAPIIQSGAGLDVVSSKFVDLIANTSKFKDQFKGDADTIARVIQEIVKPGGANSLDEVDFKKLGFNEQQIAAAAHYHDEIAAIVAVNNDLAKTYDQNAEAIGRAGAKQFALLKATQESISSGTAFVDRFLTPIKQAFGIAGTNIKLNIATDDKSAALQLANDKLQGILTKKDEIDRKFQGGILPPGVTGFQQALDDALTKVTGIGQQLDTITGSQNKGEISVTLAGAQTNQALGTFTSQVQAAFKAGVDQGVIVDAETARKALQPLADEAERNAGPEAKQKLEDALSNVIVTLVPVLKEKQANDTAAQTAAFVQNALNSIPIDIPLGFVPPDLTPDQLTAITDAIPPVKIPTTIEAPQLDSTATQFAQDVIDAASTSGTPSMGIVIPTSVGAPVIPHEFTSGAAAAGLTGGSTVGTNISQGTALGIAKSSVIAELAAKAMAQRVIAAAKTVLQIASPSKAFQSIGKFVISGLVKGLSDGDEIVTTTVTDLISKAVAAATGAVSDAAQALRGGSSSLFSALFGSDSVSGKGDFGGLQGQITQAFNSLGDTLQSSFDRAADVLKRSTTEKLSNADLDVLGEKGGSLNPNDVLGAQNRAALVGTIDDIVALGKQMIDQGASAGHVTQTMEGYLDQLRILAAQYGLSGADVEALIGQLGLSQDSLSAFVDETARIAEVLGTARTSASKFNDQVLDLFKGTTDGSAFKSITGVGKAEDARAAITAGMSSIAAAADANDQKAAEILGKLNDPKKNGPITLADQLALNQGLNGRDINTTDQFGIANRSAFEGQIDNIKKLGEALLAGGSSADFVTNEINAQVAALEAYGASLGFNSDQIQDLVNKAGLGQDSLAKFNSAVQDAADIANRAADAQGAANDAANPTPPGTPPGSNATPTAPPAFLPHDITVNLAVPYGDPQAIALSVGNKIAQDIRFVG